MLTQINNEVLGIINRHFEELRRYTTFTVPTSREVATYIKEIVKKLSTLSLYDPELVTEHLYREVRELLTHLEEFLHEMGQPMDAEFRFTCLGQLWQYVSDWCTDVERQNLPLDQEVWSLISPAAPDCLEHLGDGYYEAKWWHPVPMMDVEILSRTEYVTTYGQPYEPKGMPNGLALRFRVQPFLDAAL
ncbi:MAG: hypothetical protein KF726_01165 [Anaerolineae bacterium]|nr:hypothetical protein [Anaerolineae bacterium]